MANQRDDITRVFQNRGSGRECQLGSHTMLVGESLIRRVAGGANTTRKRAIGQQRRER